MQSFKDNKGRTWDLAITIATVKRVRRQCDLDLTTLAGDGCKPLAELLVDVVRLADLVYLICEPQAEARGIDDEEFGQGLAGDVLTTAADAFLEALIDFFPQPRQRQAIRTVIQKGRELEARMMDRVEAKLKGLDVAQLMPGALSAGQRESSESIPIL